MGKKQKYYVVWKGKKPGIYTSWSACQAQIKEFPGARFRAFESKPEAEEALRRGPSAYKKGAKKVMSAEELARYGKPNYNSIAVDAASSGNPGVMEYRGVDTRSGKQLFRQGPFPQGTNNIGEFLAIVHGLAFLKARNSNRIIYTDSRTAMSWVRKKHCNTKLQPNAKNEALFELVDRAEQWLKDNPYTTPIVKWETKAWGEIPADFGRK